MKKYNSLALFLLTLVLAAGGLFAQQRVAGDWEGAIVLPQMDLGMIVHFTGPDDSLRATIDIPVQRAMGLPLKNVRAMLPSLHFELPAGPGLAVFEGTLTGDSITGDFRQAGITAKFRLHRTSGPKPAEVVVPPPYREEEVRITNQDVTLAGTLSMPPAGGPFPAVILITGSGAQNRDEEIFGFSPFKILADHLTRHRYAVLRCDDRGIGGSTGSMSTSTTADFATDVRAMLRYLKA
ncbi:MAG TPA: alpha/beta hydrolase, partial [Bacteroidota bacterium]|nr:alpha/beta hydrolase [Bacteroidota bacterium]